MQAPAPPLKHARPSDLGPPPGAPAGADAAGPPGATPRAGGPGTRRRLRPGEVQVRRTVLSHPVDPTALFAALSDRGRDEGSLLFVRRVVGAAGGAARTVLGLDPLLRVTIAGPRVTVVALRREGRGLLRHLERVGKAPVTLGGPNDGVLALRYPVADTLDPLERLVLASPLDALRALTTGLDFDRDAGAATEPGAVVLGGTVGYGFADFFDPPRLEPGLAGSRAAVPPDAELYLFGATVCVDAASVTARALVVGDGDATDPGAAERRLDRIAAAAAGLRAPGLEAAAAGLDDAALDGGDGGALPLAPPAVDLDDASYAEVVRRLLDRVRAGDVFQVVPSRAFRVACPDPFAAYRRLAALDPTPYGFFTRGRSGTVLGASPETFVDVRSGVGDAVAPSAAPRRHRPGSALAIEPIAGTRPRGRTRAEDERLEVELRTDPKELAEHLMLVDLARNDAARVAVPGSTEVASLLEVRRFARVMHLVSRVEATLRPGADALTALAACGHPGTVVGAPKLRAAELLAGVEAGPRGVYAGAVGLLDAAGELDTALAIRTAVVSQGVATVRAGAGVVADSDPMAEAEETRRKASAILSALDPADGASPHRQHPEGGAPCGR